MIKEMVDVDRCAGFESSSIVYHSKLNSSYALVSEADFDIVVSDRGYRWDEMHWATLCHLLRYADIFVMFFDTRFSAPTQPEKTRFALGLLRCLGIRLIAIPSGLDVVYEDGKSSRFGFLERLKKDYPAWDLANDTAYIRRSIQSVCSKADFVVSGDAVCGRFLPREDLRFKYFPVKVQNLITTADTKTLRPRIVHAPNHRFIKGTDILIDATDRLRDAGLDFELQLVEKISHTDALRIYAEADIIADQFCVGAFGVFALEGLALGKPVLTYLDEEHLGDPVFNLPIVNTTSENLERVLRVLLVVPSLRERLGDAGRLAVERYQSQEALAEVWNQIYQYVWWNEPLGLERTQHFSSERTHRSFVEDPSFEEFWPVPVDDLMPQILRALGVLEWVA